MNVQDNFSKLPTAAAPTVQVYEARTPFHIKGQWTQRTLNRKDFDPGTQLSKVLRSAPGGRYISSHVYSFRFDGK